MNTQVCKNPLHIRLGNILLKEKNRQNNHTGISVRMERILPKWYQITHS